MAYSSYSISIIFYLANIQYTIQTWLTLENLTLSSFRSMKTNLTEAVANFLRVDKKVPKPPVECIFRNQDKSGKRLMSNEEVIVKIFTMYKEDAVKIEESTNSLKFKKYLNKKISSYKIKGSKNKKKKDGKNTFDCASEKNCIMLKSTTMAMVRMDIGNFVSSILL